MRRELKYIVVNDTQPVIFPRTLVHADVAYSAGGRITSAGFCEHDRMVGWSCWGHSESLDISSKASDSDLLDRVFE